MSRVKIFGGFAAAAVAVILGGIGCSFDPQDDAPAPTPTQASPTQYQPSQAPLPTEHVTTAEEEYAAQAKARYSQLWHDNSYGSWTEDISVGQFGTTACFYLGGAEGVPAEMTRKADESLSVQLRSDTTLETRITVLRAAVDWKCPQYNNRVDTSTLQESY